jgi:hypothetical protein
MEIPINFLQKLNYHIMKNSNENLKVVKVSQSELEAILEPVTVSTTISITYLVDDARSRKLSGKFLVQKRIFIGNLYLNHDYAKKVTNLSGEAFEALPMNGKTRISTTLVRSDKSGELLLDGKILCKESRKNLGYFNDGMLITEKQGENLGLWANGYYNPTPKTTSGRGLLTEQNDFQMITLGTKNIESLKMFGTLYEVVK